MRITWLLLLSFSLILTGCTPKNVVSEEGLAPGEALAMQLWASGSEQELKFLEALSGEFIAALQLPGVTMNVIAFSDDATLEAGLVNALAEGKGPEVVYTRGAWIATNNAKLVPHETDEAFNAENFRNTFVIAAINSLLSGEQIYGVPLGIDTLALIYNDRHILERLNNRNYPARTWEELIKDATELTKTDNSVSRIAISGVAMGRVDNLPYGMDLMMNILWQWGMEFFNNDLTEVVLHNTVNFSPQGLKQNVTIEVIKFIASFADSRFKHYSWNKLQGNDEEDLWRLFLQGRVSMMFGYASDVSRLIAARKNAPIGTRGIIGTQNIRVQPLPQREASIKIDNRKLLGKMRALAVPLHTRSSNLSWRFLKFAIRQENARLFTDKTGLPTARVDLISEYETDPVLGVYVRQAKFANVLRWPLNKTTIANSLHQIMTDFNDTPSIAPENAIKKLGDDLNEKLSANNRRQKIIERR